MSNIGQEGDTRKYRKAKRDDYYASKSAVEAYQRTKWLVCSICKQELKNRPNYGTEDEPFCIYCWNETH